jgi:hypothetical protein
MCPARGMIKDLWVDNLLKGGLCILEGRLESQPISVRGGNNL